MELLIISTLGNSQVEVRCKKLEVRNIDFFEKIDSFKIQLRISNSESLM